MNQQRIFYCIFAITVSLYNDVIMGSIGSQIIGVSIVYSTVCSGADQRKHQISASLAFVRGIHRWRVNSRIRSQQRRKSSHLMMSPWNASQHKSKHIPSSISIASRIRRLIKGSCKLWKGPMFRISNCYDIWQAPQQHGCRAACQISKRCELWI